MSQIRILTESDLRSLVPLDKSAVDCVEGAFRALAGGDVVMPPVLRLDIPTYRGEVDVKTAYVPGLPEFAIKISPGFFDNPSLGLPSTSGLMVVLDSRTGQVRRLLLDNGYLTDIRTAAAGAVAAKYLARSDASIATILGAGMQARLQLEALVLVRPISEVRIWGRCSDRAAVVANDVTKRLGISASTYDMAEEAVRGAHIIVTTTPSPTPILHRAWIEPGQHITAMGSDAEHKNEIDPSIIACADLYVADRISQTKLIGELHHALSLCNHLKKEERLVELGDIVAGTARGRTHDRDVTFADLTGIGAQDTAIAALAGQRADVANTGEFFES